MLCHCKDVSMGLNWACNQNLFCRCHIFNWIVNVQGRRLYSAELRCCFRFRFRTQWIKSPILILKSWLSYHLDRGRSMGQTFEVPMCCSLCSYGSFWHASVNFPMDRTGVLKISRKQILHNFLTIHPSHTLQTKAKHPSWWTGNM